MFRSRYDQMVVRFVKSAGVERVPSAAWLHAMQGRPGMRTMQWCGVAIMMWSPGPVVLAATSASLWLVAAWSIVMLVLVYTGAWIGLMEYRAVVCAAYQHGRTAKAHEVYAAGVADGRTQLAAELRAVEARRKAAAVLDHVVERSVLESKLFED